MTDYPERLGRLIKAGFMLRLMRSAFQVIVITVLVRLLNTEAFGTYAFLIAVGQVISVPAQLGLPQLVVREASTLALSGDRKGLRTLARWASRLVIAASLLGVLAGLVVLFFVGQGAATWRQIGLAMLLVPLVAFINVRSSQLRGMGIGVRSQLAELIVAPGMFLALVCLMYAADLGVALTLDWVLVTRVLSFISAAIAAQWLLAKAFATQLFTTSNEAIPTADANPLERLKSSAVLGLSAGIFTLNGNLDILMLTYFRGEEFTAIYRVAALAALSIAMAMQAVNSAIGPTIARSIKLGWAPQLQAQIDRTMPRLQLFVWLIVLCSFMWGRPVLEIAFGDAYVASYFPMLILCAATGASAFFGPAGLLLNFSGNELLSLKLGLVSLAINICLNLLLIVDYGSSGAATATFVATFSFNFLLWVFAWKRTNVNTLGWIMFRSA